MRPGDTQGFEGLAGAIRDIAASGNPFGVNTYFLCGAIDGLGLGVNLEEWFEGTNEGHGRGAYRAGFEAGKAWKAGQCDD